MICRISGNFRDDIIFALLAVALTSHYIYACNMQKLYLVFFAIRNFVNRKNDANKKITLITYFRKLCHKRKKPDIR